MSARFCSSCGAPLVSGDRFCSSCGGRVVVSTANRRNPDDTPPSPTYRGPTLTPTGSPDADFATSQALEAPSSPTTVIQHVYVPASEPKKSHAGAIVAVVIIVVLLLFLFVIPLPTSFSRDVSTVSALSVFSNDPSAYAGVINITLPGSAVSGSYTVSSGQPVAFYVVNSSGAQIFTLTAGSGTFSFTASPGSYAFLAVSLLPDTVSITGSVSQPLAFGLFYSD
jgi:hypothetical protein